MSWDASCRYVAGEGGVSTDGVVPPAGSAVTVASEVVTRLVDIQISFLSHRAERYARAAR
jgi:hypothetical protein